jgi:hypothetical protein
VQEPSEELAIKTEHLNEKLAKLEIEMQRVATPEPRPLVAIERLSGSVSEIC